MHEQGEGAHVLRRAGAASVAVDLAAVVVQLQAAELPVARAPAEAEPRAAGAARVPVAVVIQPAAVVASAVAAQPAEPAERER